ncbi:Yos1-like protein [Nitzschia inconspicua]|uniref:Yos1-like protein n=1 Tax=Nitzschia inconspicua TaxID=303405 RepID=A0A9K3L5Q8_9STRA|nr:Yos1-like protein [Nitzschia inconspicua]KAG7361094.1 Yos1-like protein [Nitzschia inconspicua]
MFSVFKYFKVGLLLINSIAILNRKRFLSKLGMDDLSIANDETAGLKGKFAGALQAASYLKLFIALGNVIAIVLEIFIGG